MHFGVTEKPMTDRVSLYNNADLISKVSEEIASENAENCRRQPHCRLTLPLLQGTPATHLFCNRVRTGRSRSSNVVDFGTNRKGVCDFQLVIARDSIYAKRAYAIAIPSVCPSVRLSVCPSHGWISQKRLKLGSCNIHHTVAPSL